MTALAPFVRIGLRYLAAFLVAKGLFQPEDAAAFVDPEMVGAIVAVLNEAWYAAARKWGWEK